MKKILFVGVNEGKDFCKVEFNVNWFEYLVLKNIFQKKKFTCWTLKLIGQKYDMVVTDEVVKV